MWEQVVRLLQQQRCNVGHRRLMGRKVPADEGCGGTDVVLTTNAGQPVA
jgi:hypothetical protein